MAQRKRKPTAERRTLSPPPARERRRLRDVIVLGVILCVGLGLRVGYLREVVQKPDFAAPVADALFHDYWARALATGDWTPPPNEDDPEIRGNPYLRPPGYPHFLAGVYGVLGQSYLAARLGQMGLGLASCVLAYLLGRSLFGRTSGLVTAGLMAIQWGLIFYEGELQEPFLLVFLTLAVLLAWRVWAARPQVGWAFLVGGAMAAFALVRPNVLLLIPLGLAWMAWVLKRRNQLRMLLGSGPAFLLGLALLITPVTLRNYFVARDSILISSNGAINLYIGNNPTSDGYTPRIPNVQELTKQVTWGWFSYNRIVRSVREELGRPAKYSEVSAYFAGKALDYMREYPGRCLVLAGKRLLLFWGPAEVSNNKVVHYEKRRSQVLRRLPGWSFALATGLLGLVMLVARRDARRALPGAPNGRWETCVWLVVFIVVYSLSFTPFLVAERFRVPVVPILLMFSGVGLATIVELVRTRALRLIAVWGVVGLALYGLARVPWVPYQPDLAAWHHSRGIAWLRAGQPERAIEEQRAAIAASGSFLRARRELATLLLDQGSVDDAVQELETAAAISPRDASLHDSLGHALAKQERYEEAEAALRSALRLDPRHVDARVNLGIVLAKRDRRAEAIEQYRQALAIDGRHTNAQFNLGNALLTTGRLNEAATAYRAAIELQPTMVDAHIGLGAALARAGRSDEAIQAYQAALEHEPGSFTAHYNLAAAYASRGDFTRALASIRVALQIQPNHPAARQMLTRLQSQDASSPRP